MQWFYSLPDGTYGKYYGVTASVPINILQRFWYIHLFVETLPILSTVKLHRIKVEIVHMLNNGWYTNA
jgi:hypothetical protein